MTQDYMLVRDIDWFAKVGPYFMHFASNGSIIPIELNARKLSQTRRAVARVIENEHYIRINERYFDYLEESGRLIGTSRERYLISFGVFASKGFYSFDYDKNEKRYILVAAPANGSENRMLNEVELPILNGEAEWEKDCISQIREMNGK